MAVCFLKPNEKVFAILLLTNQITDTILDSVHLKLTVRGNSSAVNYVAWLVYSSVCH